MVAFLLYIIKSSCCLTLFYLGYKALLSHESFFRFNRKVLLGGMFVCLLLPLVKLKTESAGIMQQPFMELEKVISAREVVMHATEHVPAMPVIQESHTAPSSSILLYLYVVGFGITLFLLIRSFLGLYYLLRSGRKIQATQGYRLILLNRQLPPFNWWKYIVLSESDYRMYPNEILAHEQAHLNHKHSLDLVFAECLILLHWFNPAIWLLKRELQDVHEYQADTEVLKQGIDATRYQLLLVKKAVGSSSYTFANSFNQSKLKKRITMMCKKQSNQRARWKLALLAPAAVCTLYAFAQPDMNRQLKQLIPSESTTILQDNQNSSFFFDDERQAFLDKLSYEERMEWLEKNTRVLYLFVNKNAQIMFSNERITLEQLPAKLKAGIQQACSNPLPITICYLSDLATPADANNSIKETAYDAIRSSETLLNEHNKKIFFYQGSPKIGSYASSGPR